MMQTAATPADPRHRVVVADDAAFARATAAGRVLVKFTGAWCPPCKAIEPTLDALRADNADVTVVVVDTDDSPELGARFGVRALPTLLMFRDGRVTGQLVGNQPRATLDAFIRR